MGTKSLFMLKINVDSIGTRIVNDFVYGNMLWAFGSLRVFICNYVLYSFGLILRYIFRFLHLGDATVPPPLEADGTKGNHQFPDSDVDGFPEELANFLFWREDYHEGSEEREEETESSVFMDTVPVPDVPEESEKSDGETDCSVLMDTDSNIHEDSKKTEVHTERSVSKKIEPDIQEDSMDRGTEEDGCVFMESDSVNYLIREDGKENGGETEVFVSAESDSGVHEDGIKMDEDQTNISVLMGNGSDLHHDSMKRRGEQEKQEETEVTVFVNDHEDVTECYVLKEDESNVHHDSDKTEGDETDGSVFAESECVTTARNCQYLSRKDIIGFIEEPTTLSFSFRDFYMNPDVSAVTDNAYANTRIIADKEIPELDSEKYPVAQEKREESFQEQVSIPSNVIPFLFESEAFGGTDSSDEDNFLFNENSVTSDSESESSSSSGLIWANSNKIDDSIAYQFLGGKSGGEGFESEIMKLMMREERAEDVVENESPCDRKVSEFKVHGIYSEVGYVEMDPGMKELKSLSVHGFGGIASAKAVVKDKKEGSHHEEEACSNGLEKTEETWWEKELGESESDEQDEDDLEWEHDDLVEQLKLELRNARQGGLATILEEEEKEEEEEEETRPPKLVEDLKPLKIEEKLEYKDQIDEIEKVYKSYAEKMRKLDILNYQTMHALGLIQLKDPLKSISIPKSTIPGAKPLISQNLWSRKASKNTSDPLLKLVHDLHRDLELVYVGQVCLSWEILCWQLKKAHELQQYDSQGSRRYNFVAGEFQLFQVLLQRFIENEPFQGPRIQNYVKNRCVIRNLLQVPAIKDDGKGGEEHAIASGRLAEIIKESMRVFWEFVRADKDYGNVILKVSQQIGTDLKDPLVSGLLVDIRTQLQKKERKLKDIVRSGNCIVKKFQKHHEDPLDHEQLVAQVGLRLISRVVNMSRLRKEQLIWCNEKLHRIRFLSRKIVQVEPSFSLFPC